MGRILACSDIHGCFDEFDQLLLECKYSPNSDQLFLLGDYIDRGPNSRGVVQRARKLQQEYGVICLYGNHEDLAYNALNPRRQLDGYMDIQLWMRNGGFTTILSYEGHRNELDNDAVWFKSLHKYYETDQYIFTHAHPLPGVPVQQQSLEDLVWRRHDMPVNLGKINVHGHTPMQHVTLTHDQLCIDTACVFFGGRLTMVSLPLDGDITSVDDIEMWSVERYA